MKIDDYIKLLDNERSNMMFLPSKIVDDIDVDDVNEIGHHYINVVELLKTENVDDLKQFLKQKQKENMAYTSLLKHNQAKLVRLSYCNVNNIICHEFFIIIDDEKLKSNFDCFIDFKTLSRKEKLEYVLVAKEFLNYTKDHKPYGILVKPNLHRIERRRKKRDMPDFFNGELIGVFENNNNDSDYCIVHFINFKNIIDKNENNDDFDENYVSLSLLNRYIDYGNWYDKDAIPFNKKGYYLNVIFSLIDPYYYVDDSSDKNVQFVHRTEVIDNYTFEKAYYHYLTRHPLANLLDNDMYQNQLENKHISVNIQTKNGIIYRFFLKNRKVRLCKYSDFDKNILHWNYISAVPNLIFRL